MLISGIFVVLAFIASIILAVQNKDNRHDHEDGRYRRREPWESDWGPSYCDVWNCDTIVARSVGCFCFILKHHAFVNPTSVSKQNIRMLIIKKNCV